MITFVDAIYDKLVVASKFTAEGWLQTMKILDRICEDLFAPKEGVVVAVNVEDPSSICAHMMFSCVNSTMRWPPTSSTTSKIIRQSGGICQVLVLNSGFDKVEKFGRNGEVYWDGVGSSLATSVKAVADLAKRVDKLHHKNK
jgi:hypothetical protein